MRKLFALLLVAALAIPATALAAPTVEELQKKIQELSAELEDISDRVDSNEKKTATDRINWYGDLRVKADTLQYKDLASTNFGPAIAGTGMPFGEKKDFDNDILYTTRLRLGMKAKAAKNVSFSGRLSMYKVWGDSTGVQVFDSFNAFTTDGTNGGNPTGDFLRVERAYFDWKDIGGSDFYLSIGRRPSTYGPPSQFRENELRGGTPSGHLVHFNFDGITLGYKLSDLTGIEGQTVRFCYGLGYESDYGNGNLMNPEVNVEDVHLGGINFDALNDGTNFLQFTLFRAENITDAFKGLAVYPAFDTDGDGIPDSPNQGGFVSRIAATENIGDMWLGGIGFTREEMNGMNWFVSGGWNRSEPNGKLSQFGFGGLLTSTAGDTKEQDGFSAYAGIRVPAPLGKFGLEYNYGSKYWFAFTQAQDDIAGSKLAARGNVGEAYYIFDINPNMFIKVGGIYYDYEYSGSGVQVGEPVKVQDIQDGKAFTGFPVPDKVIDGYASLTVKF